MMPSSNKYIAHGILSSCQFEQFVFFLDEILLHATDFYVTISIDNDSFVKVVTDDALMECSARNEMTRTPCQVQIQFHMI